MEKENITKKERNIALDIIRIVALFSVISVHFFLNNEYYSQVVVGKRMYIMTLMRTAFMICVPLFIMLTGYLMSEKKLSKEYYAGIKKTIIIYILASITCGFFKNIYLKEEFSFSSMIFNILNFSAANYSWYIEMYIGLFLLIPFLNILYTNLITKKNKQMLILTLLILTSLPSILNIYNFTDLNWWKMPSISNEYSKLVPNWWEGIYPLTYYFIGTYLKEYNIKMKKSKNLLLIICTIIFVGTFNYYRSYGSTFVLGEYQKWGAIFNIILTILVFIYLVNIKFDKCPSLIKNGIIKISNLCLGAYLLSYIFDQVFYKILNAKVPEMLYRLEYYIIIVPIVFISSLLLSYILDKIYTVIIKIVERIKKYRINKNF